MLTWHVDRLFRSGPLCALGTLVIPLGVAVGVAALSDEDNVIAILIIASMIIGIGSVAGSVLTSGVGTLLFCFGTFVAEIPVALMAVVAGILFSTLMLHDMAGMFRRAPQISRLVWKQAGIVSTSVAVVSTVVFGLTYFVATRATLQAIVVPFGVAAIGFAAKLAADSHASAARALTRKGASQGLPLLDEQPTAAAQGNGAEGNEASADVGEDETLAP